MSHNRIAAALLGAGAVLLIAACTAETISTAEVSAPAVTIAGGPVDCIQTSRIRNTAVHDDYTIDFEMAGGDVYRNTLPGRCPGLGFEERFSHASTTGSLCGVDTITVLYTDRGRGATCGLGQFVPVRYVDAN
jgi:hypothetical protein